MQILIGLIYPFKLILLYEITMSCLIPNNNNYATEEVIESTMMGIQKPNSKHAHISSQNIFTSHLVRFYIGIDDCRFPSSHLCLNSEEPIYCIERGN